MAFGDVDDDSLTWDKVKAYLSNPDIAADAAKRKLDLGYEVNPMAARNELLQSGNDMPSQEEIQNKQNQMGLAKFEDKAKETAQDLAGATMGITRAQKEFGPKLGKMVNKIPDTYLKDMSENIGNANANQIAREIISTGKNRDILPLTLDKMKETTESPSTYQSRPLKDLGKDLTYSNLDKKDYLDKNGSPSFFKLQKLLGIK